MAFWRCVLYLFIMSALAFALGRLLPKHWFNAGRFPFRCFNWEQNGKVYDRLRVRYWQDKVPDMSRVCPKLIPPKRLGRDCEQQLPLLIKETCVAELVHFLHSLSGLACLDIWPGIGGVVVFIANIMLCNLPFIIIQRYNRPRLLRLQQRFAARSRQVAAEHPAAAYVVPDSVSKKNEAEDIKCVS